MNVQCAEISEFYLAVEYDVAVLNVEQSRGTEYRSGGAGRSDVWSHRERARADFGERTVDGENPRGRRVQTVGVERGSSRADGDIASGKA